MSSAEREAPLQLLLTEADEYIPVLADGLDERLLDSAPRPERDPDRPILEAHGADPNDLPTQRWGVVAPQGERGDRMLAAIDALIQHRRAQQGVDPRRYRVPPAMDLAAATTWRDQILRAEDLPEDERPRYLLLLGDLHEVSLELQHVLAAGAFVGRLQCPDLDGFRRYAEKVVQAELAEPDAPSALFYAAEDGSLAVEFGRDHLIDPCFTRTVEGTELGRLALAAALEVPHGDGQSAELLRLAGATERAVLLSLSHGLGAPRRGWRSPEEQRARQGALFLGVEELGPETLTDAPFLPGGAWFSLACFSAGTPPASAFHPWLAALAAGGRGGTPDILRSLPRPGEHPFIAALPQAALANPRGPLAVIGHIDLAWVFGFTDPTSHASRASRVFSTLRSLLTGGRAGVALDALLRTYRDTNDDLASHYQRQRDAAARHQADPADPQQLGRLWLQRNDLRGYVLLGDPAARLTVASPPRTRPGTPPAPQPVQTHHAPPPPPDHRPRPSSPEVRPTAPSVHPAPPPPDRPRPSAPEVRPTAPPTDHPERAVLALLHGDESPRAIADRFGISVAELFLWLDRYRHAGRRGLPG